MVVGLPFCWWDVPYWFEKSAVVEPVDVLEGGVLDLVPVAPWSPLSDEFDAPMMLLCSANRLLGEPVLVSGGELVVVVEASFEL